MCGDYRPLFRAEIVFFSEDLDYLPLWILIEGIRGDPAQHFVARDRAERAFERNENIRGKAFLVRHDETVRPLRLIGADDFIVARDDLDDLRLVVIPAGYILGLYVNEIAVIGAPERVRRNKKVALIFVFGH